MLEEIKRWWQNHQIKALQNIIAEHIAAENTLHQIIEKLNGKIATLERERNQWKKIAIAKRFKDDETLKIILDLTEENNLLEQALRRKRSVALYE